MENDLIRELYPSENMLLNKAQRKLALPLWIRLLHAKPGNFFHVLLTLEKIPGPYELEKLQQMGLQIEEEHRERPGTLIPGIIEKIRLEQELVHCEMVRYIETISHGFDRQNILESA